MVSARREDNGERRRRLFCYDVLLTNVHVCVAALQESICVGLGVVWTRAVCAVLLLLAVRGVHRVDDLLPAIPQHHHQPHLRGLLTSFRVEKMHERREGRENDAAKRGCGNDNTFVPQLCVSRLW